MNDPLRSLWGSLIGDASGAFLEGLGGKLDPVRIHLAMTLPGGGRMATGKGQITDDGELSLALWSVLRSSKPADGFPIMDVARAYGAWYDSMPFDIGQTCSFAFEHFSEELQENDSQEHFDGILQKIHELNHSSEANGAMMRVTPIAVWYASQPVHEDPVLNATEAAHSATTDARLSHSNQIAQDANAVYVYALTLLLQGLTPADTIRLVESFIATKCDKVQEWFRDSNKEWMEWGSAQYMIGHVKHAFIMTFWFLRHSDISYEDALYMILEQGGDTDTNAAIVCGLVACYQPLPEKMKAIVHSFDATTAGAWDNRGHLRPKEYCVKYQLSL